MPDTDEWPSVSSPVTPATSMYSATTPTFSEDTVSLTSASSMPRKLDFQIPDMWRPSVMHCIQKDTDEERRLQLDVTTRSEIVRDLVTQMFAVQSKPTTDFAGNVAKKLVRKFPFMKDAGDKVSGHVSRRKSLYSIIHNCTGFVGKEDY